MGLRKSLYIYSGLVFRGKTITLTVHSLPVNSKRVIYCSPQLDVDVRQTQVKPVCSKTKRMNTTPSRPNNFDTGNCYL